MNPITASTTHLKNSKMTYLPHLFQAFSLGLVLIVAGIASMIHAILPCFFQAYSANKVTRIFYRVILNSANPAIQNFRKQEEMLSAKHDPIK